MKNPIAHPALSRGVALALLLGLAGLVYFGMIEPLVASYRIDRREIADLQTSYTRFERIAAEIASRRDALAAAEQQRSAHEGFLRGTNETLMAAAIQSRIKSLAVAAHGELTSTQILPTRTEGKLKRITVQEQFTVPISGLAELMYRLEGTAPYLFLDNVDIRLHAEGRRRGAGGAVSQLLDVRFDAYGYAAETPPSRPEDAR